MKCDQVRELLPEHLLGSLDGDADARVEHHLRGCTDCRAERLRLEEGVATLAYATHESSPPEELREHVLTVLEQEWQTTDEEPDHATVVPLRRRARARAGSPSRRSCSCSRDRSGSPPRSTSVPTGSRPTRRAISRCCRPSADASSVSASSARATRRGSAGRSSSTTVIPPRAGTRGASSWRAAPRISPTPAPR